MSRFKEALNIIHRIHNACTSNPIWSDSADGGLPTTKDDQNWKAVQQLINYHGIPASRIRPYKGTITQTISIIEEFSTGLKAYYEISYHSIKNYRHTLITPCDGYFTIRKVMPSEHDLINRLKRMEYDATLFNYKGHQYSYDILEEDDNRKIWHECTSPNGQTTHMDFSPYTRMTAELFKAYIDYGQPKRVQGNFRTIEDIRYASLNQPDPDRDPAGGHGLKGHE